MQRYFNVAGPCVPGEHYMLPAQERCQGILDLIRQHQYFVIHAARQSGKTTLLFELIDALNASEKFHAIYCSLETLRGIESAEKAIPRLLDELQSAIRDSEGFAGYAFEATIEPSKYTLALREALTAICRHSEKPVVIFFDEVDCLADSALIAFLQQLRYGYVKRGHVPFVNSIALVGMRNIRDYRGKIREDRDTLGSASPFNIIAEALTLRNFTRQEIARLYAQHTDETGQAFPAEVVDSVYAYTQGQPWLVNMIAREIVTKILGGDATQAILPAHVEQAVQSIIMRRDTHIDSLMERLKEARIRRVVTPLILGDNASYDALDDDYQYALDVGLLTESDGEIRPANPIYAEVILRTLSSQAQMSMQQSKYPLEAPAYMREGRLDMEQVLRDFQRFWRENSAIWEERFEYKEAAPHLVLQAFLQRVINGGGRVQREMANGRKRLDICVEFREERFPLELKIRYDDSVYDEGKAQLAAYMDALGCAEGWLLVFDRRPARSWEEKIFWRTEHVCGKIVHIVGG